MRAEGSDTVRMGATDEATMVTTVSGGSGRGRDRGQRGRTTTDARRQASQLWGLGLVIALVAFGLRATHLDRSFDVFGDELIYLNVAQNTERTLHVAYYGTPFFLHPPMFFYLEAAWLKVFEPVGNAISSVYAARYLNAVVAALSVVALFLLVQRMVGRWIGIGAACIFALEPFIIRINSRVLIETTAMFWILVGYCLLVFEIYKADVLIHHKQPRELYASRWRILGAGAAFGTALLTKEATALLTLLPLGCCSLVGWSLSRTKFAVTAGTALLLYALYPLSVMLFGDRDQFVLQKSWGVLRLIGLRQQSGFNAPAALPEGPSFVGSIIRNLDKFATTYTLIALGAVGVCVLLAHRGRAERMIAAWVLSAFAFIAYSVAFGTNEEQYYYYLVVPSIVSVAVGGERLWRMGRLQNAARKPLAVGMLVSMIAFVGWTGYVWAKQHFTPDNGLEQLMARIERQVPGGSRIIATNLSASDYALKTYGDRYEVFPLESVEELRANRPIYVITAGKLIETGYDVVGTHLDVWLAGNAERVFAFDGPTNGRLSLYYLPDPASAAAPVPDGGTSGTPPR